MTTQEIADWIWTYIGESLSANPTNIVFVGRSYIIQTAFVIAWRLLRPGVDLTDATPGMLRALVAIQEHDRENFGVEYGELGDVLAQGPPEGFETSIVNVKVIEL